MGPDFLTQELGWFSQGAAALRGRSTRALQAQLDFEDDWDEDLADNVAEITDGYDEAEELEEFEDEELLESVEHGGEDSDDEY